LDETVPGFGESDSALLKGYFISFLTVVLSIDIVSWSLSEGKGLINGQAEELLSSAGGNQEESVFIVMKQVNSFHESFDERVDSEIFSRTLQVLAVPR
jgi:hypothetical protein